MPYVGSARRARRRVTLGDYPVAFAVWSAQMKGLGAEISALPNDPTPILIEGTKNARIAATFRDPAKWGPLVNTKKLPMPTAYTKDGRTAYFVAPDDVQRAYAKGSDTAAQKSADAATPQLLDRWNIPDPLRGLDNFTKYFKYAALFAGLLAAAQVVRGIRGR